MAQGRSSTPARRPRARRQRRDRWRRGRAFARSLDAGLDGHAKRRVRCAKKCRGHSPSRPPDGPALLSPTGDVSHGPPSPRGKDGGGRPRVQSVDGKRAGAGRGSAVKQSEEMPPSLRAALATPIIAAKEGAVRSSDNTGCFKS